MQLLTEWEYIEKIWELSLFKNRKYEKELAKYPELAKMQALR